MKPSEIIKLARRQTWCTEDIVTSKEAIDFLNFAIEDFGADIRATDSWYGFTILNIDVTAWVPTYTFDQDAWGYSWVAFPIHKLQSVWLKDMKTWKWQDLPIHFVDKVDYNRFQSNEKPRACFVTNHDINIIPYPKENSVMQIWWFVYNWNVTSLADIKVWGVEYWRNPTEDWEPSMWYPYAWTDSTWTSIYTYRKIPTIWETAYDTPWGNNVVWTVETYTDKDTEDSLFIPARRHYILVEGLKYRMYWNMWVNFETARANSRAFFDSEKMKAIQNYTDRWQLADTPYMPNLNFLNY